MVQTAASLAESLEVLRGKIDAALDAYTAASEGYPEGLRDAMRYSLLANGKRLRAVLVLLATQVADGPLEDALPAACAVEMVHAYSLIHDDLPAMDDDDLRRGKPTNHKVYGEAMAILAGDALLTRAFEIMASDVKPPQVAASCTAQLAKAAGPQGMVGGQVDDLEGEKCEGDLDQLHSIHRRKTGALLGVSLELGATIAGANETVRNALATYGEKLGLAFQITDDLLDVRGEQDAVGKRVGKDSERGKLTFPALLGVEASERQASELVEEAVRVVSPFGAGGRTLADLARYVLERDR